MRRKTAGFQKHFARCLFIDNPLSLDRHADKTILGQRMRFQQRHIRPIALHALLCLTDFFRILLQNLIFQFELVALVIRFHQPQLCDLDVQIHLFPDTRIARAQRLDFRIRERRFVHIVAGADGRFAGHDLADKALLVLDGLPQIAVKRFFCDISVYMHVRIHVALPHNAPRSLLQIARPPRRIQIMQSDQSVLNIGACAKFLCAAKQNPHLSAPDLGEQIFLFDFRIRVMDELNLLFRNPACNQFVPDIVIDVKRTVPMRRGQWR